MVNFSYAVRVFKAELQSFLNPLVEGASRPVAKLFFYLAYGFIRSGSSLVSLITRSLFQDGPIDTHEHRLTKAMSSAGPKPIESALAEFAIGMSAGFFVLDESDVQKPYEKALQWLDDVQDGSAEGRPKGKGYHVIGRESWAPTGNGIGPNSAKREGC